MDKEKLMMLCENLDDVEHRVEELARELQKQFFQLQNIRRGIIEALEEEIEEDSEEILNDPVENVEETVSRDFIEPQPEKTEIQEQPQPANSEGESKPLEVRYCSMLISNEFEFYNTELSRTSRSIYIIEVMSETTARFYPIADQAERLIMNRSELLDPICVAGLNLTPEDLVIGESAYGQMERNRYGRWNIVKHCSLLH